MHSRHLAWLSAVLAFAYLAIPAVRAQAPPNREADKAFQRGKELLASGDLEKALEKLDEAVKLDPKLAAARVARAFVENGMKKYDAANADAAEARRLDPNNQDYRLTGVWYGTYVYPGGGIASVRFRLTIVQDGKKISANVREPNTFWESNPNVPRDVPFLYAICDGEYDPATKQLRFTKSYDGASGASHSVEYSGTLSDDGTQVEGDWSIGGAGGGTFRLQKARPGQRTDPESTN